MPNELLHLRIGSWILHPDAMLLPVAGLFFLVIAYRALCPALMNSGRDALVLVTIISFAGVVGARLYGLILPVYTGDPVIADGSWYRLRFGSMGGVWGILLATLLAASLRGRRMLFPMLDALVPAICLSAAVARISCVYQGCCAGVDYGPLAAITDPVRAWPILDILALLGTAKLASYVRQQSVAPGNALICFLFCYGSLRFCLEFLRDTYTAVGLVTWGQFMSLALVMAGMYALTTVQSSGLAGQSQQNEEMI